MLPMTPAYFERESSSRFRPTELTIGAWKVDQLHIGPAMGLLAHAVEADHVARHGHLRLQCSRLSYDILGVLPVEPVDVSVRVIRPGRTIELVEAQLDHDGRTALTARAWFTVATDTAQIAGSAFAPIEPREQTEPWQIPWQGGFIESLEARQRAHGRGRATTWARTRAELVAGELTSPLARLLSLVDVANGLAARESPDEVIFPNVDLTAHLARTSEDEWIGFDTSVTFGPTGLGMTHTVLHDQAGPFGTVVQSLTVRPR